MDSAHGTISSITVALRPETATLLVEAIGEPKANDVTRRRIFDPGAVPIRFWQRDDVQASLAHRDVAQLFRLFLDEFSECTQTQLALLTQHDRSDISNWVRGIRQGRVSDIEVLIRIADGLHMPDQARALFGLAPVGADRPELVSTGPRHPEVGHGTGRSATVQTHGSAHVAICGSRAPDTEAGVIDVAVRCLARLVMSREYKVSHGPVGVGIEVMTYIADRYRPPGFTLALGLFGHRAVVQDSEFVIVVGGAVGTQTEIDLALSMNKKIIPLPGSGGAARRFYRQAAEDRRARSWMADEHFAALHTCHDPGEDFVRIIEHLIDNDPGVPSD